MDFDSAPASAACEFVKVVVFGGRELSHFLLLHEKALIYFYLQTNVNTAQ